MNHLHFVNDLMMETRRKRMQWEDFSTVPYGILSPLQNEFEKSFTARHDRYILLIGKAPSLEGEGSTYTLVLMDWNMEEEGRIDGDNLFDGTPSPRSYDALALERLYRIARRNAQDLDRIMERIINHI